MIAADIDRADSLGQLSAAYHRFSGAAPFDILEVGFFKISYPAMRSIIYRRRFSLTAWAAFSDALRLLAVDEALICMAPIDLLNHAFLSCNTSEFSQWRRSASQSESIRVLAVPFRHEKTLSLTTIRCSSEAFLQHRSFILQSLNLAATKTFALLSELANALKPRPAKKQWAPRLKFPWIKADAENLGAAAAH